MLWESTAIGTKDEDHRSRYGIIIETPKTKGAGDKVEFGIPSDFMQANVVIKGESAVVSGGSSGGDVVINCRSTNLILVGGPAVNRLSAEFLGLVYPAYGADSGISSGEAIISLKDNGNKVAMIVAGYEAGDTVRASRVLRDYSAYASNLKGAEVTVKGTTSNPTVVASVA